MIIALSQEVYFLAHSALSDFSVSASTFSVVGSKYITAVSNPCVLQSNGLCSTYVSWRNPGPGSYKIRIRENPGSVFADGITSSGGQWASWISQSGATFDLYQDENLLDSVYVKGIPANALNLTSGLISYWNLDEGSGSQANDLTITNTGTAIGTTIADGKINKARSFNTLSDKIDLNTGLSLSPSIFLSASAWVWANSFPENDTLKRVEIVGRSYSWWLKATNRFPRIEFLTGNTWNYCQGPEKLSTDTWYHLAGTYDYSNLRLYVNGVLIKTCPASGLINDSGYKAVIGSIIDPQSSIVSWNGKIDEVGIWNRPLSDAEIQSLAAGNSPTSNPSSEPSSTPAGKIGDLDGDGDVDIFDFNTFVGYFRSHDNRADLNGVNGIDIQDFNLLVENFRH